MYIFEIGGGGGGVEHYFLKLRTFLKALLRDVRKASGLKLLIFFMDALT